MNNQIDEYLSLVRNALDSVSNDNNYANRNFWINKAKSVSDEEIKANARSLNAGAYKNAKERTIEAWSISAQMTDEEHKAFVHLTECYGL